MPCFNLDESIVSKCEVRQTFKTNGRRYNDKIKKNVGRGAGGGGGQTVYMLMRCTVTSRLIGNLFLGWHSSKGQNPGPMWY